MSGGGIEQYQLDRLFTAALEAAIARLEKDGHFQPLLFELRESGAIHNVAVLDTETVEGRQSVLDRLIQLLRPRARDGMIRAAAIVLHRADEEMIEVRLRALNYSSNLIVPFDVTSSGLLRKRRELALGQFAAKPSENEIFRTGA